MSSRTLCFNCIDTDTVQLSASAESYSLFADVGNSQMHRLADVDEPRLVAWIMADESRRALFLKKVGLSVAARFRFNIPKKYFESLPNDGGDVDFVGADEGDESKAVCVEFKRIKVKIDRDERERLRKVEGLMDLIRQGNERQSAGFHRSIVIGFSVFDNQEFKTLTCPPETGHILQVDLPVEGVFDGNDQTTQS